MSEAGKQSERASARPLMWWDLGVAFTLAVMAMLGWMLAQAETSPRWASESPVATRYALLLAPLVLFAALYLALGRRVLRRAATNAPAGGAGTAYLVLLIAVVGCAVFADPLFATLQALAYPMLWSLLDAPRRAVAWSAVLAAVVTLAMFATIAVLDVGSAFVSAAFSGPISFVFAVAMGLWITGIHTQGQRYRELAEQLRETQGEVAALSIEAGAATERERLSRELHDTLTQTLTGLVMLSEQAERALGAGNAALAEDRLSRVQAAAREAVAEARALVATTQPLADGGLMASIERVAASLQADTGLAVRCALEVVPMDREREVVLLRAAQEGMANARKHARAGRVTVSLTASDDSALLVVEDDGVGPDAAQPGAPGFGLSGLGERVRAVGGSVQFGAARGFASGARLEVRVPVPWEPEPEPARTPVTSEQMPGGAKRGAT